MNGISALIKQTSENFKIDKKKKPKNKKQKETPEVSFASCENTARRWPSENKELSSHQTPNLLGLYLGPSSLQNREK